jgi:conjugative transfer signal peptidase TraF
MPESRGLPPAHWVDDLRRTIAARRRRLARLKLLAVVGLFAVPVASSLIWKPPVLLVWNASASAPIGLYRVQPHATVRRGDMVVAWTPGPSRALAAARHYLPANIPLVKRVAAADGDSVCAAGRTVRINGRRAATRQNSDSAGRPMPRWSSCRTLARGEYLLLMDSPRSFDGRYFGLTRAGDLVGKAVLLWAKPAQASRDG